MGLVETDGDRRQIHVVDNWFYLGSVETLAQAAGLRTVSPSFDSDGYKILCGPIMSGRHDIIELT